MVLPDSNILNNNVVMSGVIVFGITILYLMLNNIAFNDSEQIIIIIWSDIVIDRIFTLGEALICNI